MGLFTCRFNGNEYCTEEFAFLRVFHIQSSVASRKLIEKLCKYRYVQKYIRHP